MVKPIFVYPEKEYLLLESEAQRIIDEQTLNTEFKHDVNYSNTLENKSVDVKIYGDGASVVIDVDNYGEDINSLVCAKIMELATKNDFVLDLHTSKMSDVFAIFTQKKYMTYIKTLGLKYNQYSDDASIPSLFGTFNAALDRAKIDNLTIECGGHDEYCENKICQVFDGICNLLSGFLMITEKNTGEKQQFIFAKRNKIYANCSGLMKLEVETGKKVKKGEVIAKINLSNNLAEALNVLSPIDGILLVANPSHIIWQGDVVAEIVPLDVL